MIPFSNKVEPTDTMFIQVPRADVESCDINPTLQHLNRLKIDKVSAQVWALPKLRD